MATEIKTEEREIVLRFGRAWWVVPAAGVKIKSTP
jgi:hypothetical protein